MADIETMTGGCLCGAVRYEARNVSPHYHACHCGMCRRWGGGPFLGVDAASVQFESEASILRYSSSEWAARGSCADCGSSLFYHFKPEDRYVLCAGSFDDQSALVLANEIYIDHKPAGYEFGGEQPVMTEAEVLANYGASE
jgi:hypothetical protein